MANNNNNTSLETAGYRLNDKVMSRIRKDRPSRHKVARGTLASQVADLQEACHEVTIVLAEVISTITNPINADSTVRELHEAAARTWSNYFDAPKPEEDVAD